MNVPRNSDNSADRVVAGCDEATGIETEETGRIPSALERALQTRQMGVWLQALSDPHPGRWRVRMQAIRELACTQPDPELANAIANTLAMVLDDDVPGDDRDEREASLQLQMLLGLSLGLVVCAVIIALLWAPTEPPHIEFGSKLYPALLIVSCLSGAPLWRALLLDLEDYRVRRLQLAVANTLCQLKIPQSVGALALVLRRYPSLRGGAEAAFVAAVSGLTAEDYGTLPPNTVPRLCDLLASGLRNETVDLHCLLALERVGDGRAIPYVTSLAARGRTLRVREAAAAALPVLEQRHRQETDRHMLLRGTTSPSVEPSLLLRSTSGTDRPEQMLRPVGPQPDGDTEHLLRSHPQH